jgi:hypothetical protein
VLKKETSVNHTSEFFEGPIANDYPEILAAPSLVAAAKKKAKTGKGCSVPKVCAEPSRTTGATCGKTCSLPKVCPKPSTTGRTCSLSKVCVACKKAEAFETGVPGWSSPPAPPSL